MLKKLKKLVFSRVFIVGLLIAIQLLMIFMVAIEFTKYFVLYYIVTVLLALVYVLKIINTNQNMAYKLAWIVVIFLFPAFGVALYMIFCGNMLSEKSKNKMKFMSEITTKSLGDGSEIIGELSEIDRNAEKQAEYIRNAAKYPPYRNSRTVYFKTGEEAFVSMLEELEKAEKYIFIEYFIIKSGEMWEKIHEILVKKVKQGIDVRVIYDDIGCINTLNRNFAQQLEKEGIKCRVFHRFIPVLSAHQNNRDHRKICVIDGKAAFTGGINLADEYINTITRFGYWKDNAILTEGEAAWSFTVMFLEMWDYLCHTPIQNCGDYDKFRPETAVLRENHDGFVQPYSDDPLDFEPVGENVYLGIISAAHDYVWITTPYLIIDEQMEQALLKAVKSGVDVRIITPGIPDKKIINETTKSFYPNLIKNGVKIYEYDPGFIHAKTFICDDIYATVGSVNLDYRSLYLHFECGAWMYKTSCIRDIKEDFIEMFESCTEQSEVHYSLIRQLFRGVLELLAPLL
ncbi:MAG: cardiolipin synthase [Eubacteriales bacterium]